MSVVDICNKWENSLTSLLTCVFSQSFWLLCVMLCFTWRAIIFSIKYTTCISLSFSEWNFNQRPLQSSDRKKFRKITRRDGKENNALSREMENTKIIICEKQLMHMLKCQDAAEKLIAFWHKRSLINMITFAYFILPRICCIGDSCDSWSSCSSGPKKTQYLGSH